MRQKLPIRVFWDAFLFPFSHFGALFRIVFIPGLLLAAIIAAAFWQFGPEGADFSTEEGVNAYFEAASPLINVLNLIFALFTMMFAVHLHRYIVRGEDPGWVLFRFGRYELMYLLTAIVATLCLILVIAVVAVAVILAIGVPFDPQSWSPQAGQPVAVPMPAWGWPLIIAAGLLYIWVVVRLVLMLPHAAIAGRLSFSASWRAMKGNVLRFIVTALLLAIVLLAAILLLVGAGYFAVPALAAVMPAAVGGLFILLIALYALVWIFYFAAGIALLSYTYAHLIGNAPEDAAAFTPGMAAAMR